MDNLIKKAAILFTGVLFLSGCATYKFQYGKPPLDKGYVVARDERPILEYTVGKDNSVPRIKLAKERFNRRKKIVEDYYKRMGVIQNHFTMAIWEPTITFMKLVGGVFRLPFIAISDYRYEHNPKYKEKIRKVEAERDLREAERIKRLKDKLDEYVQKDLAKEAPITEKKTEEEAAEQQVVQSIKEGLTREVPSQAEQKAPEEIPIEQSEPEEVKPPEEKVPPAEHEQAQEETVSIQVKQESQESVEVKPEEQKPSEEEKPPEVTEEVPKQSLSQEQGLKAVITAKPEKGNSPLRVQFDGRRSTSAHGKIISYLWDFGDAETSTKPNPVNTYWSTTYGSRYFTAVLTVKDEKGNTGTSSIVIEVITK